MTKLDQDDWYSVWVIMQNEKEGIQKILDSFQKKYGKAVTLMLCHKANFKKLSEWFPDIEVREQNGVTTFQVWIK